MRFKAEKKLSIKNFKSIREISNLEIKQNTVFLGPNGSGKSTILDAISIFCNSIWGWFHHLEQSKRLIRNLDFNSLISSFSDNKDWFSIGWNLPADYSFDIKYSLIDGSVGIKSLTIIKYEKDEELWKIVIHPDKIVQVKKELNHKELNEYLKSLGIEGLFQSLDDKLGKFRKDSIETELKIENFLISRTYFNENTDSNLNHELLSFYLDKKLFSLFYPERSLSDFSSDTTNEIRSTLRLMALSTGLERVLVLSADEIITTLKFGDELLDKINDIYIDLIQSVANFEMTEDIRLQPPEYFESISDKIINDYFGLCQLLKDIQLENQENISRNSIAEKYEKLKLLLKEFEIADSIKIEKIGELKPNTVYYQILLFNKQKSFPLKNLSSGGKQIFPIILNLISDNPSYLTLRQPELHLHPKLQVKIPEIINDTTLRDGIVRYFSIVETHSEHIIRKFQVMIAKGILDFSNVAVYYLDLDAITGITSIKKMELESNGNFKEPWPNGFFDEASDLAYALLDAQINRKN